MSLWERITKKGKHSRSVSPVADQASVDENGIPKIPKLFHRIWLGSMLPQDEQDMLAELHRLNPDYQIKLWTDKSAMLPKEYQELTDFAQEHNIQLVEINDRPDLPNFPYICQIIQCYKQESDPRRKRILYSKLSDMLRISYMYVEGGIHTDADYQPLKPLGELTTQYGFLQERDCDRNSVTGLDDDMVFYGEIIFGFQASTPKHPVYQKAVSLMAIAHQCYMKSENLYWESSEDPRILSRGVIATYGYVMIAAVNNYIQKHKFNSYQSDDIFFEVDKFFKYSDERTWLNGFSECGSDLSGRSETFALNAFRSEIKLALKTAAPFETKATEVTASSYYSAQCGLQKVSPIRGRFDAGDLSEMSESLLTACGPEFVKHCIQGTQDEPHVPQRQPLATLNR